MEASSASTRHDALVAGPSSALARLLYYVARIGQCGRRVQSLSSLHALVSTPSKDNTRKAGKVFDLISAALQPAVSVWELALAGVPNFWRHTTSLCV